MSLDQPSVLLHKRVHRLFRMKRGQQGRDGDADDRDGHEEIEPRQPRFVVVMVRRLRSFNYGVVDLGTGDVCGQVALDASIVS